MIKTCNQRVFRFTVSAPKYPIMMKEELNGIRSLIGDFDVIKIKEARLGTDIKIWVRKKDK